MKGEPETVLRAHWPAGALRGAPALGEVEVGAAKKAARTRARSTKKK